jgi:hypothetical protein
MCGHCPSITVNVCIFLALFIGLIFVCAVIVKSTLRSAHSEKSLYSIYLKIFTNYLQLVFLTSELDLSWPWYAYKLFTSQNTLTTGSDQLLSLECYLASSGISYEKYFYINIGLYSHLPLVLFFLALITWIGICAIEQNWKYMKREFFTTIVVLFFLFYPNIVRALFSIFSCKFISDHGWFISSNLIVQCYTSSYLKFSLLIGLSGIILWALGVPTLVLVLLIKRRNQLSRDTNRVIFGFLYNGYKRSRFFWEIVIAYRKIAIICATVFMNQLSKQV